MRRAIHLLATLAIVGTMLTFLPVAPALAATGSASRYVGSGPDDGFGGPWAFTSSTVWFEAGNPGQPYGVWLRFTDVTIPKGATITSAMLYVTITKWDSGARLKISADKAASPTAPTSLASLNGKARTAASAAWNSSAVAATYSPDFKAVIQELVSSYDYSAGGAIQILLDDNGGSGEAVGRTYEFGAPARLDIAYTAASTLPSVVSYYLASLTPTSAVLNGNLQFMGSDPTTSVSFLWGTAQGGPYPNQTPVQVMSAGGYFSAPLSGLTPGTKYYWRATATTSAGVSYGEELSFVTPQTSPGGKIVFAKDDGLWVVNADGTGLTRLTPTGAMVAFSAPAWSPDGTKIAHVENSFSTGDFGIHLLNADGSYLRFVTNGLAPAWSPDGTKLAFNTAAASGGPSTVCTINTDGTGLVSLATGHDPCWSADGQKIYYAVDLPSTYALSEIYVMNADGTNQTRLTDTSACTGPACLPVCTAPAVSPGGGQVAYLRCDASGMPAHVYTVYLMQADGSDANQHSIWSYTRASAPAWAPDGSRLAAVGNVGMTPGIFILNADGSNAYFLTSGTHPSWKQGNPPAGTVEVTKSTVSGPDDGFGGPWAFTSSTVWFEAGNPGAPYSAWFRFTGITIPQGATILAAYLSVMETKWDSGTRLKISADKAASPTAPTSLASLNAKVHTTANVAWNTGYADSAYHNSPDISAVIQELVNANGYSNGAIQLLVDNNGGNGEAVGRTFEFGQAPRLYIKYRV